MSLRADVSASSFERSKSPQLPEASLQVGFDNTYARLPERFFARVNPTPVVAPRLVKLNVVLARTLGLDPPALESRQGVEILAGNRVPEGAEPLAMGYAGHQFGYFVPQLGDGRANLLGELVALDGKRYDLQLKGSGPTPYSRRGDGRAALGPVLREYLLSEAMAALRVPTTRALAAVTTGERVLRDRMRPGAVLTRVAASHLRVGTFQYFAAQGDVEGLRALADYAITRHYPQIRNAGSSQARQPYRALLESVVGRQAQLIAQWMLLGFIHGVMNTDNMSISGETIDYGPCAFLEAYDPHKVYSSIDQQGRYAFGNQPHAAHWNLTRLAEALLPLLEAETGSEEGALQAANGALAAFAPQFEAARLEGLRLKLGLLTAREGDGALAEDLLRRMAANGADFTLTFRRLSDAVVRPESAAAVRALFTDPGAYDAWAVLWRRRCEAEPASARARAAAIREVSPAFIPRNHLVEAALNAAVERADNGPFETLLAIVSRPYDDQDDLEREVRERHAAPATPEEYVGATFCGT